jgi:hypothetical protein
MGTVKLPWVALSEVIFSIDSGIAAIGRSGGVANAGVASSDDKSSSDTTNDGSTTDEITRVDTMGDESNASNLPVISFNDFITSLLKVHRYL